MIPDAIGRRFPHHIIPMSASKTKLSGHASHTQDAAARGLPGSLLRPIKITMLGAGSAFTPRLMNDILRIPGDQGGTIALVDIDRERLDTMVKLVTRLTQQLGKANWKVIGSADRRKVMAGSNYIVNCIEVSGTACVRFDNDIPAKYGINQCIGDQRAERLHGGVNCSVKHPEQSRRHPDGRTVRHQQQHE